MEEFLTLYSEVKQLLLDHGVSQVDVITGVAGKDVNNVVVIQTYKSLTDNGAANDVMDESPAWTDWITANKDLDIAVLVSHDLYQSVD